MLEKEDPILDLMAQRIKTGSNPYKRDDPFYLELIIQGRGMAGVITGGMVTALEAIGAKWLVFDEISGVSSGAWTASYFAAEQSALGTSMFYQDLTRNFVDFKRAVRGGPIMDIDQLMEVMLKTKRLDLTYLKRLPVPLHIFGTKVGAISETVDPYPFKTESEIEAALNITPRIPLVTRPGKIGEQIGVDGTVILSGIPLKTPLNRNRCRQLVLMASPKERNYHDFLKNQANKTDKVAIYDQVMAMLIGRRFPGSDLDRGHLIGARRYKAAINSIYYPRVYSQDQVRVSAIEIDQREISRLETRAEVLLQGAKAGYNAVLKAFAPYLNKYNLPIDESIKVLD